MFFKKDTDPIIEAYKDQISYLKKMIDRLVEEREAERVEFKRAIDILLVKQELPIVGQVPTTQVPPIDPTKFLSYMDEEVKGTN